MKLSILVPVYNESGLIAECLSRVRAAPLPPGVETEIIVVDDGSTDGTAKLLDALAAGGGFRLLRHLRNQGKGAAVRTALSAATGEVVLIQDGDLEYDPADYPALLQPFLDGKADAVFGSRFAPFDKPRVLLFWHTIANRRLTALSNVFTGLRLTDMWTCYKAARAGFLKDLPLRCNGFCLEPELTAKLARQGCRIVEVPIRYRGRAYSQGKKIGLLDAARSLGVMLFFWVVSDLGPKSPGR